MYHCTIQVPYNMDFFTEVSATKARWRRGEGLTLMTTASTIGPSISPMFTPASMAIPGYKYGYTEKGGFVGVAGEETAGQRGGEERLGKGAPLSK